MRAIILSILIVCTCMLVGCEKSYYLRYDSEEVVSIYIEYSEDGIKEKTEVDVSLKDAFLADLGKITFRSYPDAIIDSIKNDSVIEIHFSDGSVTQITLKRVSVLKDGKVTDSREIECTLEGFTKIIEKYKNS